MLEDTIKVMTSSCQQQGQENEEEEKEDSAMAALMRNTDEEIVTDCELVRDVIENQRERAKRETVLKLKSCLKS